MKTSFRRPWLAAFLLFAGCSGASNSPISPPADRAVNVSNSARDAAGGATNQAPVKLPSIAIVQAVGGVATTGAITLAPTFPVAGDLLLIFGAVAEHIPRTSSAPVGFSEITAGKDSAPDPNVCNLGHTCIANYYKIADGSEPASYRFTDGNPNTRISASFVEFSGVDTAHPIFSQTWQQGRSKTLSCPSAGTGDLAVCLTADNGGTNASMLVPPSGITAGWRLVAGTEQIPEEQSSMAFIGPANTAMTATLQMTGNSGNWAATTIALKAKVTVNPSPSPTFLPPAAHRAMWVWTTPDNQTLVDFAEANNVRDLFYSVSSNITGAELTRLRSLKALTDAAGITLDALGGDPTWATTNTQDALTWETSALATGLFVGAHFDIEPATLPGWNTNNAATIAAYLSALDRIRANSPVHFEVDVPFWYGQYRAVGYASLADAVIAKTDETSTMSYRNTATGNNSLFGVGQDMLARAQAAGKPTRLGAETNNVQPSNITFYTVGNVAMQAALPEVDAAAASYTSYQGIAIEDYFGWKNLGGVGP